MKNRLLRRICSTSLVAILTMSSMVMPVFAGEYIYISPDTVVEKNEGAISLNEGTVKENNGNKIEEVEVTDCEGNTFPIEEVTAGISTNNGLVETNNGLINVNNGDVRTNSESGTINYNDAYVMDGQKFSGTVNDNEGYIGQNRGTVEENNGNELKKTTTTDCVTGATSERITTVKGIDINTGDVVTNNGAISQNMGTVVNNSKSGDIFFNGVPGTSRGVVENNAGKVDQNHGTVKKNEGTVVYNAATGTVNSTQNGVVDRNEGTVVGGTVKENVVDFDHKGGTVTSAIVLKTLYELIKDGSAGMYVHISGNSGANSHGNALVEANGSVTLGSDANGYNLSNIKVLDRNGSTVGKLSQNSDGSWTLSNITDSVKITAEYVKKIIEEIIAEAKEEEAAPAPAPAAPATAPVATTPALTEAEIIVVKSEATVGSVEYVARQEQIVNTVVASIAAFDNMTPEQQEVVMKTGMPINAGGSNVLSASVVDAIKSNNKIPYNVTFTLPDGGQFNIFIPAKFNFRYKGKSLLNADGTINVLALMEALGYLPVAK